VGWTTFGRVGVLIDRDFAQKWRLKKGSGRWGCRPLVGMGVMEVQRLEVPAGCPAAPKVALQSLLQSAVQGPESTAILPGEVCSVDRPLGSIISGTKVPLAVFA
jgi:hypothetical protein